MSFELLARLYERLRGPQHRHAIIKASQLPRLDADGTYCTGPPDTEQELAAAVAGVLRGLAALHAEGTCTALRRGACLGWRILPE